jgi:hypothetical protein
MMDKGRDSRLSDDIDGVLRFPFWSLAEHAFGNLWLSIVCFAMESSITYLLVE